MAKNRFAVLSFLVFASFAGTQGGLLADTFEAPGTMASCAKAGPQTPRDILNTAGENPVRFSKALPVTRLRLCDIHFHRYAEHKIPGTVAATPPGEGFVCRQSSEGAQEAAKEGDPRKVCESVELFDTVEVHWVYTSCNVEPAPGLESCLSPACVNPELRAVGQVFYLTPDNYPRAVDWRTAGYDRYPPAPSGNVEFLGSTTGDKYNGADTCSPFQVSWSVARTCRPMTLSSLGRWCDDNVYDETKPQGVRSLVTDVKLLARIP